MAFQVEDLDPSDSDYLIRLEILEEDIYSRLENFIRTMKEKSEVKRNKG